MINLTESLIKNISASKLLNEPFDHKFVKNIFPKEMYENFLENIPDKSLYTKITDTGSVSENYSPERYIFNFEKSKMDLLNSSQKVFFQELLNSVLSKDLFTSVTSQFSGAIQERMKNFSNHEKDQFGTSNFEFSVRAALVKDFTKYSLGAHTDSIGKFVTYLFYIPKDNSLENVGTALYKPIKEIDEHGHFDDENTRINFEKIKTCPFIPNCALIFPRTSKSYHGVEEVNINKQERNLFLLNYYLVKKK